MNTLASILAVAGKIPMFIEMAGDLKRLSAEIKVKEIDSAKLKADIIEAGKIGGFTVADGVAEVIAQSVHLGVEIWQTAEEKKSAISIDDIRGCITAARELRSLPWAESDDDTVAEALNIVLAGILSKVL